MKTYIEAHDAFISWLEGAAHCEPTADEVDNALRNLATCAAGRGMTGQHWTFVVDGLIAHAKRRCPENPKLPQLIAHGFEFSDRWPH